jgi:hypothetical protein
MAYGISVFDAVPTNHAQIPWVRGNLNNGMFIGVRLASNDYVGAPDLQTIVSQRLGPGTGLNQYSWHFYLTGTGDIGFGCIESGSTSGGFDTGIGDDITVKWGIADTEDCWVGVEVWFDGGFRAQFWWGGTGATPVWEVFHAAQGPTSGIINIRSDTANVSIGDGRYGSGPEDEFDGTIYEVYWETGEGGPGVNPKLWHWNGNIHSVGDGNTDTGTGLGSLALTWTLTGDAAMITDDAAPKPTPASAMTGTLGTEAGVIAGGQTIILSLTDDTWDASVGDDHADTQGVIDGLASSGAEAGGWAAIVVPLLDYTHVVRTSATVVTITLPAAAAYAVTASEVITATIPAIALTSATEVVSTTPLTIVDDPAYPVVAATGGQGGPGEYGKSRQSGPTRRRIVDLDDIRRKYRTQY